jgi:hypothetical protein
MATNVFGRALRINRKLAVNASEFIHAVKHELRYRETMVRASKRFKEDELKGGEGSRHRIVELPCFLRFAEKPAPVIKEAGVSRETRAGCAADRFLVHSHEAFDRFHVSRDIAAFVDEGRGLQFFTLSWSGVAQLTGDQFDQHLTDQAPTYPSPRRP